VVVYNPASGWVSGNGTIVSPVGAYTPNPSLTGTAKFGFVSKYVKGATVPTGNTEFNFKVAKFKFKSTSYDWLVVSGAKAQYKGSGVIKIHTVSHAGDEDCENESHFQTWTGDYGFLLTATDGSLNGGGGVDKFRMKIVDKSTGSVVYDNLIGSSDDPESFTPQAIASGKIVIHSK
jgi:hypothetical protein